MYKIALMSIIFGIHCLEHLIKYNVLNCFIFGIRYFSRLELNNSKCNVQNRLIFGTRYFDRMTHLFKNAVETQQYCAELADVINKICIIKGIGYM